MQTEISKPRKMSKMEIKKAQIYQEKRLRLLNQGVPEEKVDEELAKREWDSLPADKKIKRLEKILQQSLLGISRDIHTIVYNQQALQDAMDINFTAIGRSLEKAGVSDEVQQQVMEDLNKEIQEREAARRQAQQDAEEKARVEDLAKSDEPSEAGAPIPEEATVFGG